MNTDFGAEVCARPVAAVERLARWLWKLERRAALFVRDACQVLDETDEKKQIAWILSQQGKLKSFRAMESFS